MLISFPSVSSSTSALHSRHSPRTLLTFLSLPLVYARSSFSVVYCCWMLCGSSIAFTTIWARFPCFPSLSSFSPRPFASGWTCYGLSRCSSALATPSCSTFCNLLSYPLFSLISHLQTFSITFHKRIGTFTYSMVAFSLFDWFPDVPPHHSHLPPLVFRPW